MGVCTDHRSTRWINIPCKRRACPVCGAERRKKIAWRIAHGIELLADEKGAGWFVGSFVDDIDKPAAVKVQRQFIKWVRKRLGYKVEYAATWELTRRGRLHVNIIMAPWRYIPQSELSAAWLRYGGGKVVWIKRVGGGIGVEAAKSRNSVAGYFAKFEQMVQEGRSACYSKGWPDLPDSQELKRLGDITWLNSRSWGFDKSLLDLRSAQDTYAEVWFKNFTLFEYEKDKGYWLEVRPGEYKSVFESCDCFELVPYSDST